jgi:hypothetical protein
MARDSHPRPTHDIAVDTYQAEPLPDFEVFQAVTRETADTLEATLSRRDL